MKRMSGKVVCKICGSEVVAYQVRKSKNGNEYYAYCLNCNKEGWIGVELIKEEMMLICDRRKKVDIS